MRDFLDKELHSYFEVCAYILDPSKCIDSIPQALPSGSEPLDGDPFDGLFKIDVINAQRGFSDPNAGEGNTNTDRRLSSQLRQYFDKHLDPTELPDASDLDTLEAIEAARTAFDDRLKMSFNSPLSELEGLNYPGFSDPQIILSSKVNPLEALNHDAAVQFNVLRDTASPGLTPLCLPEKYNGLGFQNLISMVFNLIRFRDEWMRVGKAGKRAAETDSFIEPLHLILIEEPEAHLHAQAAHRLKPLIESLGLLTLVVTDLDSIGQTTNEKVLPAKGKGFRTGNATLKGWIPCQTNLDELISADNKSKETADGSVRVAFQCPRGVTFSADKEEDAIPYTFEDAFVLSNLDLFRKMKNSTGLIKKMCEAVNQSDLNTACNAMFEALQTGKKAEMALELLFTTEPNALQPPKYIKEGLEWLKDGLERRSRDFVDQNTLGGESHD